jgi:hypothetical protein
MKKISFLIVFVLMFLLVMPAFADDGVARAPVTYEDVLSIGVPIASLLVAIAALVRAGNAGKADQSATAWLRQQQADRDYMDKLERVYAQSNETMRRMFDTLASTVKVVSPYTPFGFDDEAAKFMADMQKKGAPTGDGFGDYLNQPKLE